MTQYGTWLSYSGTARLELAGVLLVSAGALAYAGTRLPLPVSTRWPGRRAAVLMLVTLLLAFVLFLAGASVYVHQALHLHLAQATPADPITPVTIMAAGITFFVIAVSGKHGWRATLASAAVGAAAGVMVFELPFDIIVMARTYPPIPPHPAIYRALFFGPLFLIEIVTLSLLTLSPMVKLSRATFFSLALMLTVFAVWSLSGFGYPSSPVPFTLNTVSKILAFVTALTLFLPQRAQAHAEDPGAGHIQRQASR